MKKGTDAPNFILITTDQQRFDTIACLGNQYIDTPHMDWLVDEGVWFSRAYVDAPMCVPSRASIMTGLSGAALGQTGMSEKVMPLKNNPTLPGVLTKAGYQTRAQGKLHFYPVRANYGFETVELPMDYYRERHRLSSGGEGLPKEHGMGENEMSPVISTVHENDSLTHWTVRRSIDFLETRDPTRPFFLWTSFTKPHPPFDPPANYWSLYANRTMPGTVYGDWSRNVEDMPQGLLLNTYTLSNVHRFSPEQLINSKRAYYATISHIDFTLGLLFARMRELGLLKNTWIIFTSDHGEHLGNHHLGGKGDFLEGSAHVPLIVRPPGGSFDKKPYAGRHVDTVVSLQDIMPTILEQADIEDRSKIKFDGTDLMQFLDQPDPDRWLCGNSDNSFLGVIESQFKYQYIIHGGVEQLFDIKNDPQECHNLAVKQEFEYELVRLRKKLILTLEKRNSSLVENGKLIKKSVISGRKDVTQRWPGFHSTVVETDMLH